MDDPTRVPTARAVLVYALGRWQTAAVVFLACLGIAATILLLPGNLLLVLAWLLLGISGVVGIVVLTFRDPDAMAEALRPPRALTQLRTPALREAVRRAEAYQTALRRAVATITRPELRASLELITARFGDAPALVLALGQTIERFQSDPLIQADLARLRGEQRRGQLSPAEQEHLENLEQLAAMVREAQAKIEAMLAQLGSSYAEVQTISAAGEIRGGRIEQALAEVADRAQELRQLSAALEEVYAARP
ncbi:MAG: hypothetical protein K6U89_12745 [Chloroflexi bacterium]|nr:hypothetical protein [Chloroflexota bacterium]